MATRSTATKAMSTAFANLAEVREKMDNMIETKRNSHTDFYNTYKSVRKVSDKKGKDVEDKTPTPPVN